MKPAYIVSTKFDWNSESPTSSFVEDLLDLLDVEGVNIYQQNRSDYWVVETDMSISSIHKIAGENGINLSMRDIEGRFKGVTL